MNLTTDPNDPKLKRGIDEEPVPQNEVYLVLSEEERAKGFVRPVRNSYVHIGKSLKGLLKSNIIVDTKSITNYNHQYNTNYYAFVKYDESFDPLVGRFITKKEYDDLLNNKEFSGGCGTTTTMETSLAETYARNPKFYGSTYCCGCRKHLSVDEFVWDKTNEIVGS